MAALKSVLIVEDEKAIRAGIRAMVSRGPVPVETVLECRDGAEALEILMNRHIDVMLTDIRMPNMGGLELARRARALPFPPMVVVISGYDEFDYAVDALRHGVRDYILKPIERERLYALLEALDAELAGKSRERGADTLRQDQPEAAEAQGLDPADVNQNIRKLMGAVDFIKANYRGRINMAMVSNHVSMNYTQFSTLFKQYAGSGFNDFLRGVRIAESKRLLAGSSLSVREVGVASGFVSEKHFLRSFKQETGVSPGGYRRSLLL